MQYNNRGFENKTGKTVALNLIIPQKTQEKNEGSISIEHSYSVPQTPIEPQELNDSAVCTELLSETRESCRKLKGRLFVDLKMSPKSKKKLLVTQPIKVEPALRNKSNCIKLQPDCQSKRS